MSKFKDLYNQQREWNVSSNLQQQRKSFFNNARKETRTRTFDLFRGDIAKYEPEEIKPLPKFRDTVGKLRREKKKKVVKNVARPFVVGTVRHKIHSPPFLHGPLRIKEPKKKSMTPIHIKSFAPRNYKFRGPIELKVNLVTPQAEEKSFESPFALNTVFNKLDNKSTKRKNLAHENITIRPRYRRSARLDSSPNSVFSTGSVSELNTNDEHKTTKRKLWPEDQDDEPVFGRINLYKKHKSHNNLSKDDEKENSDLSQEKINISVHPHSNFNCNEEPENLKMKNLLNYSNFESTTPESTEHPDANTSKASDKYDFEQSIPSKENTVMDCNVSQISPPKTILSDTISNFDSPNINTDIDNTISKEKHSSCSTPSVQKVSECTPKQLGNSSDASTILQKPMNEMVALHSPLKVHNNLSKSTNDERLSTSNTEEPLLMATTICDNIAIGMATTESSCEKIVTEKDTVKEFSPALDEKNEEFEEYEPNLEKPNKYDKIEDDEYSSPSQSIRNSSNVNEQNVDSTNLHEDKHEMIFSDVEQKSNNHSSEIQNNINRNDIPPLSRSSLTDNCSEQTMNAIEENAVNFQESPEKQFNEFSVNLLPAPVSNQTCPNKDDALNCSSKISVEVVPKLNIESNNPGKSNDDHSQVQESEPPIATSDSTSSNSPIITGAQPNEVHEELKTNSINDGNCESTNLTLVNTPNSGNIENLTLLVDSIGVTDNFKVSCGKLTSPLIGKENNMAAKAQIILDATDVAKTVSDPTLNNFHTPRKVSQVPRIGVTITSPTGLEKTVSPIAANNEGAHAGTVQTSPSAHSVPVINLTNSPVESINRMSMKFGLRKSTGDSPLLLSMQKPNPLLLSSDQNVIVDLISDDEEDYTSFLERVLKKHDARISNSPKQSPRSRSPLAPFGNISRLNLSPYRTPRSPLANSPAKRTPVSLVQAIPKLQVSPAELLGTIKDVTPVKVAAKAPIEKTQVLHNTPSKTPQRRNVIKGIATELEQVSSPLRETNLRSKNISVSPLPKKTPLRPNIAKDVAVEVNKDADRLHGMNLKGKNISTPSFPKKIIFQVESSCKSPIRLNMMKEIAAEANEDTNYLRVMSLRSRNISVTPSPKKMFSRVNSPQSYIINALILVVLALLICCFLFQKRKIDSQPI